MGTCRLRLDDVPREWSEIPDRLSPLHGIPDLSRALRKQQHAQALFFDEEAALEERFRSRTARRTSVGTRLQGLSSEALGETAQGKRVVNRKAGLHRTLPLRVPPAGSRVSSGAQ